MTVVGLAEGRIVHFVLDETEHRPAIVVKVWRDAGYPPDEGVCNLQVFTDGTNDRYHSQHLPAGFESGTAWKTSVHYSEEPKPGTWHWPERE